MTLDNVTIELQQSNKDLNIISQNTNETTEYLNFIADTFKSSYDNLIKAVKDNSIFAKSNKVSAQPNSLTQNSTSNSTTNNSNDVNQNLSTISQNTNETNEYLELSIDTFKKGYTDLIKTIKGNSLLDLENSRELKAFYEKLLNAVDKDDKPDAASAAASNKITTYNTLITNFNALGLALSTLAATAGIAAGVFAGFVDNLRKTFKVFRAVVKLFSFNVSGFTKFVKIVKTFATRISKFISYIGSGFRMLSNIIKGFGASDKFTSILSKFKGVFTFFANIGKKLLTPLFVIYETVKGAIEGYGTTGDVVGAIKGAIVGFFKGFIGEFLDLIKSAISWVAGFLGFKDVEKSLDSFSFVDLFKTAVDTIFSFLGKIFSGDLIGIAETVGSAIKLFFTQGLGNILDLTKSLISSIAGFFGLDKIKELLDSFSFVDIFTNIIDTVFQAFSDITNGIKSVWNSVKDKFNKVLSFFGIGSDEKEEVAAKEYDNAKRKERAFRGATAVGVDDKGNIASSTRRSLNPVNGLTEDVESAEKNVEAKGFKVLKGDERKAFNKSLQENTSAKKKAYEDIKNAPKMTDYMPDFGNIFNKIGESISAFVTGAVDWVKEQFGFTGEGMPSFSELVLGLYTLPYNLIKTFASKIAGFFGFDEVASQLEALDFKDIIKKVISSITDMVSSAIEYIIGKFKSAGTAIADIIPDVDSIKNFLKSVLRNILPVADANDSWFSVKNLVAKAIPNSVYKFAEMDPKTGAILQPPETKKAEIAAANMNSATAERAASQSTSAAPNINASNTSNVNNVSNNSNTTIVKPPPSPTRRPDNASDILWNSGGNLGA